MNDRKTNVSTKWRVKVRFTYDNLIESESNKQYQICIEITIISITIQKYIYDNLIIKQYCVNSQMI